MPGSLRNAHGNVVQMIWTGGRCFALVRAGGKTYVRPLKRKKREPMAAGAVGVVVPFPTRPV